MSLTQLEPMDVSHVLNQLAIEAAIAQATAKVIYAGASHFQVKEACYRTAMVTILLAAGHTQTDAEFLATELVTAQASTAREYVNQKIPTGIRRS